MAPAVSTRSGRESIEGHAGGTSAVRVGGARVASRCTGYLLFLPFSARDLQRLRIRLTDSLRDESSGESGRGINKIQRVWTPSGSSILSHDFFNDTQAQQQPLKDTYG